MQNQHKEEGPPNRFWRTLGERGNAAKQKLDFYQPRNTLHFLISPPISCSRMGPVPVVDYRGILREKQGAPSFPPFPLNQ